MAANQTQIPVIHHEDKDIVQLQQNVNKVLRNINNQTDSNQSASLSLINQVTIIGEVKSAMLSESQFQSQAGTNWILSDGRDVTDSQYHSLTGNSTVPDIRGLMIRGQNGTRSDGNQNPDGNLALGTYSADKFESHNHRALGNGGGSFAAIATGGAGGFGGTTNACAYQSVPGGTPGSNLIEVTGGNETAPANITVNFFIRIN